jgi:D-alanyl-D-alanine carboxypeptidase
MRTRPRFSMNYREPARTTPRIFTILVLSLLIVIAVSAAAFGYPHLLSSPFAEGLPTSISGLLAAQYDGSSGDAGAVPNDTAVIDDEIPLVVEQPDDLSEYEAAVPDGVGASQGEIPTIVEPYEGEDEGTVPNDTEVNDESSGIVEQYDGYGEDEGAVPEGTGVFDNEIPGVANLDAALLAAIQQAATDAAADGVEFFVESGWRTPEYQNQLRRDAVYTYGSETEAARWVATPEMSAHVSGNAIDIGSYDAMAWLSENGAAYGLCQIYSNEPWHYELRPDAKTYGCPPPYADPTQDPRMKP